MAVCLEALRLTPGPTSALVLNAGTGFMVACVADMVGPHGNVLALEANGQALARAQQLCMSAGLSAAAPIQWLQTSAMTFAFHRLLGAQRFDRVVATVGCPPGLEHFLLALLAPGGRLVMPVYNQLWVFHRSLSEPSSVVQHELHTSRRVPGLLASPEADVGIVAALTAEDCGFHCTACASYLFPLSLVAAASDTSIWHPDGAAIELLPGWETQVPGLTVSTDWPADEFATYRELSCPNCNVHLGLRFLSEERRTVLRDKVLVVRNFVRLQRGSLPVYPLVPVQCRACAQTLAYTDQLISADHTWAINEETSERAFYVSVFLWGLLSLHLV